MSTQNRIRILAELENRVSSNLDKMRDDFDRLGKGTASSMLVGQLGAQALAKGIAFVAGNITKFVGDSVDAYRQAEVSVGRLDASLRANVAGWDGNTDAIERNLKRLEQLGFDDEDTRDSLARLVGATHDVTKAFQVQSVAMDLARFKGITLSDATDALLRVEGGSYRILKSLGIALREGATQTEALAAVEKIAGGQAQKYAETDLGKLDAALARVDDSQEEFGKNLSRLQAFILPAAADALGNVASVLNSVDVAFGDSTAPQKVDALHSALDNLASMNWLPFSGQLDAAIAKAAHMGDAAGHMGDVAVVTSHDLDELNQTVADLPHGLALAAAGFGAIEDEIKTTDKAVDDLSKTIIDELYGDTIRAGKEADLKGRIHELTDALKKTKPGTNAAAELKGQIAELRVQLFNLHLQEADAKGPEAAIKFLQAEQKHAGPAAAAIDTLIQKYQRLITLQGKLRPIITYGTKLSTLEKSEFLQHGGPALPDHDYTVGEAGPERLTMFPGGGGYVTPLGAPQSAAASAPVTIALQLDGATIARVVDRRLYYRMTNAGSSIRSA
jgi:Skp family chaperone for outer membrane proteins